MFRQYWIVTAVLAACTSPDPRSASSAAPASSEPPAGRGARDLVSAWQSAALDLEAGGVDPLVAAMGTPFQFVGGPEVEGFQAASIAEARSALAAVDRRAVIHTAALVVRAAHAEPTWETPRRGEIRATLGADRGYVLTLRGDRTGWKIVRFEVRSR
jgi:hypothetical protein